MIDAKGLEIKINVLKLLVITNECKIYEMLCDVDLLNGQAGIYKRTKLYKAIAGKLAKPAIDKIDNIKVALYCAFVSTELEGISATPPRDDPQYEDLADRIKPLIGEISLMTDKVGALFIDELKHDAIETVCDMIEMDESGESVKSIVGGEKNYQAIIKCWNIFKRFDPIKEDFKGLRRNTIYLMLCLGMCRVEFPHSVLDITDFETSDKLKYFIHGAFEKMPEKYRKNVPDLASKSFNAMATELWEFIEEQKYNEKKENA